MNYKAVLICCYRRCMLKDKMERRMRYETYFGKEENDCNSKYNDADWDVDSE